MNRISHLAQLSALLAFFSATAVNAAFAYGELDSTYRPEAIKDASCKTAKAVVPDGSIYATIQPGNFREGIVRHRADGTVDKAWGNGGAVDLPVHAYQLLPAEDSFHARVSQIGFRLPRKFKPTVACCLLHGNV